MSQQVSLTVNRKVYIVLDAMFFFIIIILDLSIKIRRSK